MRPPLALLGIAILRCAPLGCALLCGDLPSQKLRLDRKLDRPLVYLAQRAPEAEGDDVLSALDDEVLLGALGLAPSARGAKTLDTRGAALRAVRRLIDKLSRFSESAEMALVGMVPLGAKNKNRPLLVFHTYLREDGVAQMRALLDSGEFAERARRVHDRQVYRIKSGESGGELIEVALLQRDLVVSNDQKTMGEMLDPRTTAGSGFGNDKRFTRLRKELDVPPGSLLCYADWQALQASVEHAFSGDASWLMTFSGIELPEQLMFVARPAPRKAGQKRGIVTTILLNHASSSRRFGTKGTKPGTEWRPDGWLDLLQPSRPRELIAGLPQGGVVAMSATIDLSRIVPTHWSFRMRRLQAAMFRAFRRTRIDLRREVLRRLSRAGGAQLLLVEPDGQDAGSGLRLAWSMRAKSAKDAAQLFGVFERMFVPEQTARVVDAGDGQKELHFDPKHASGPMVLGHVQDSLVLAFSPAVIAEVRRLTAARRRNAPAAKRLAAALASRLQRLGVGRRKLAGVFGIDLRFLVAGDAKDFGGLLGLSGGYFGIEKDLLRLEVFTELDKP